MLNLVSKHLQEQVAERGDDFAADHAQAVQFADVLSRGFQDLVKVVAVKVGVVRQGELLKARRFLNQPKK